MKTKNERNQLIIISCIVFFIAFLSITNGSMWGDEICRVFAPIMGRFMDTIKTSLGYAQPGYMLFMYLWERLTFSSSIEFVIRCSNLLVLPITIYYVYKIVKAKNWNIWTILLFFIHPMFVYYMDEATPYMIVYALSLAFIYYVFFADDFNSTKNIVKINIVYLLGVFNHFIFGFIIIPYLVKCLIENYKNKENIIKHIKVLLIFSIIYIPLLLLYLIKLVHVTTGFSIKNIAYIIYGFIGMSGLGLSRNDLRALNFSKITTIQIITLALMSIACIGILYYIVKNFKKIISSEKRYLIYLISYFIIILGCSFVIHFGVWERHCFAIFPLFMIIMIDTFEIIKNKKSILFIGLYIVLLIISSLNIRFNYYYQCDDYKGVYNYLKEENKDYDYIFTYENEIYNNKNIISKEHYRAIKKEKDKEIINDFNQNENAVLVLFEKNVSKSLYNYFDESNEYLVNSKYNSFKIVKHRSENEELD